MAENFDNNPPRTIMFNEFPDYEAFSSEYKPEIIEEKFKKENGTTLDEFISPHAKNKDDLEEKKNLYYKLYAMQDREKNDPSREDISTTIGFGNNDELCLVMRCKNEGLGDFGLVIRDGKITFSSAGLSGDQVKAAYHFLYMRGLASSIEIPSNLNDDMKTNIETVSEEYKRFMETEEHEPNAVGECEGQSTLSEMGESEVDQWFKDTGTRAFEEQQLGKKKEFDIADVKAEMEEFGAAQGEVAGLNYFHLREIGGWHVWAAYQSLNPNNIYDEVKKDKEGNLKAQFRYKVYARFKDGKFQVGYAVPPGSELKKDQAEVMCKMVKKAGYNGINFHGVQDHDFYTLRKACAKELLVPQGISLKPDGALKMIEDGRGYHPQGREVARFERMLVEQIKTNALKKNPPVMNDSEKKLYEDVYVRSNLANFRQLYAGSLKGKLEELSKDGAEASSVIGASNLIADFYVAYRDQVGAGVSSDKPSYVPTLGDVLNSVVTEIEDGKPVKRQLMQSDEIKKVIKAMGGNDSALDIKMPELDPSVMEVIYSTMIQRYEIKAKDHLDKAYENGGVTDSEQKVAGSALKNVMGRLEREVATDFRANIDLDGIRSLANHSIVLPAINSISNPHYIPSDIAKKNRAKNIAERNKNLQGGNPFINNEKSR